MYSQTGITVKSFEETTDLDARVHFPLNDFNGKKSALVKIVTTEGDFTFDNGTLGIVKAIHKPELAEWWIYMPEKTMKLKIMHPVYGQLRDSDAGFYWFPNPLKAATTYRMELTTQKKITIYEDEKIESGFLIINSNPSDCEVYIEKDGEEQFVGNTPFQRKMPYGAYNYRVKRALYHDEVGIVTVDGAKVEQNFTMRPAFGALKVTTTPPGASIIVEGAKEKYTTPCLIPRVRSGERRIKLSLPRYAPLRQKVDIHDCDTTTLDLTLESLFSQITITSLPEAQIIINGEHKGVGQFIGELDEGIYDIEVSMDKHRSATKQIEVTANKSQTITLTPTPIYGSLDVLSMPMNANVFINNKDYGLTPISIDKLLIGDYDVVLNKEGCASETRHVTISEGKTSTINVTLSQGKEITINSDTSGDEVYIDGVKQGVTPLTISFNYGSHNVELRRGDKKQSKQVDISTSTKFSSIYFEFKSAPSWASKVTPAQKQVLEKLISNMVKVEGGSFVMGATRDQGKKVGDDEKVTHNVTLSDFYIGKYEVTQEEWTAIMGRNPSYAAGKPNHPVETVTWFDCQAFIDKLNKLTGMKFRLPTEAEWEYAARGGNKSKAFKHSGSNNINDVAWSEQNSSASTHEVGQKVPNELGLYDMNGNVWEWCSDWYGDYSSEVQLNPEGPANGSYRVRRGGGWYSDELTSRVASRHYYRPGARSDDFGFRLVLCP